jgi:hypothetical protein
VSDSLAKFAAERGEHEAEWVKHLSSNIRAYLKESRAWLGKKTIRRVVEQ